MRRERLREIGDVDGSEDAGVEAVRQLPLRALEQLARLRVSRILAQRLAYGDDGVGVGALVEELLAALHQALDRCADILRVVQAAAASAGASPSSVDDAALEQSNRLRVTANSVAWRLSMTSCTERPALEPVGDQARGNSSSSGGRSWSGARGSAS